AAGYLLVAPFFVVFVVFGLLPLLYTAWVSLHDWDLIDGPRAFTGVDNYAQLLSDWRFYNALGNTVSIFLLSTVVQLLAALGLAGVASYAQPSSGWRRSDAWGNTVRIFLLSAGRQLLAGLGVAAPLSRPLRASAWWRGSVLLPTGVSGVALALVCGQLCGGG